MSPVYLWSVLLDVLVLLSAALVLGGLCERLRQSAILGYLLAGTLLGPHALNVMRAPESVASTAELGVALLLFSIGLEFSWRRLRRIGAIALGGGSLQVVATAALAGSVCLALDLPMPTAIAIGAMIAMSSTAVVLRLLISRAEIDSLHGRNALGILLLQDIAVVPMVILVTALGGDGDAGPGAIAVELLRAVGMAGLLIAGLFLILNYGVPLLLGTNTVARNRDLSILIAIVTALGATWASHEMGLSPTLGAFIAGLLLAESPYATQIRSDVASVRTLFVTLFFSAIGMLSNPAWGIENWPIVLGVVAAIVVGKVFVTGGVARLFGSAHGVALATGLCLAQVGEFSFVLAEVARTGGVIEQTVFDLLVAATIGTLFLSPFLIAAAPPLARWIARRQRLDLADPAADSAHDLRGHIVIVGFGPAGRRIAETLMRRYRERIVVAELGRKSAAVAQGYGLRTYIGDATHPDVLEHLHVASAAAVAVTLPDPSAARQVIEQVRDLAPDTPVVARARYHVYRWELLVAGARVVVDEEEQVGLNLASAIRKLLRAAEHEDAARPSPGAEAVGGESSV